VRDELWPESLFVGFELLGMAASDEPLIRLAIWFMD
jgi:hypothetical protein